MELSVIGEETLLIDGDVRSPSIAPLLGLHRLGSDETSREVAENFKVFEFTQLKMSRFTNLLERAFNDFDFVVIDLGSIEELSDSLTDRRWSATLIHWACENADEIVFVGKSDPLALHRFEVLVRSLSKVKISARLSFLLNMQSAGRKRSTPDAHFLEACAPLHPVRIVSVPRDPSTVTKAEVDRATLIEVSEKSRLRRAISKLAVELQS
jgi:Flp pilus assembly CpaE family ATPase